jgi:hypothetical protein
MNNPNDELLAAVPLPGQRVRRQVALARLLLLAIDMTLAGEPLGMATVCDLLRQLRHAHTELSASAIET